MKSHLIALFTVGIWGVTFVSTKVLLEDFSPLWILLLRFTIGFIALFALRPKILKMKRRRDELLFIAAGATGIAGYYLLENIALVFTTATAVGVIVAASPLFTAVLSALLGDRSAMHPRFFIGFALAMTGLVLVSFNSSTGGTPILDGADLLGDLLALTAALIWAIYSLLVRKISDLGYETISATKRTFLWGLVFIVPSTLLFGGSLAPIHVIFELQNLFNLVFLGIVASAMCFATWAIAVKRLGATTSTTYIYLVPAITAIASICILGEPLNVAIVTGAALTIVGLLISNRKNPPVPKQ